MLTPVTRRVFARGGSEAGRRCQMARASTKPERGWLAEVRAEEKVHRDAQERKAARTVAGHSTDATECAQLLEMLGLFPGQDKDIEA